LLHAAVTLGDGWALHKPSQGWMTPRKVLLVRDVKRRARQAGALLSRRTIPPGWNPQLGVSHFPLRGCLLLVGTARCQDKAGGCDGSSPLSRSRTVSGL